MIEQDPDVVEQQRQAQAEIWTKARAEAQRIMRESDRSDFAAWAEEQFAAFKHPAELRAIISSF